MSSTNFQVQADAISVGGGQSSSTNFTAIDTLGETATGEGLTSASFTACTGFECFATEPYITFSVQEGTSTPGVAGAGVALGNLGISAVTTSDGATVNSIFLAAESNSRGGTVVSVRDLNNGLKRNSNLDTIASSTATLVAGTAGYGICVFSVAQASGSPTSLVDVAPYDGSCTKTTGHAVGAVSTTAQTIVQSSGALKGGAAEVLVKAAVSASTPVGNDYADTLTFVATSTY